MTQLDLLSAPYQRHSETSKAAAERIQPHLSELQHKVLYFLKRRGPIGATDDEMQLGIPMGASTQRPRRGELYKMNLIRKTERRRLTKSGSPATVWEAL